MTYKDLLKNRMARRWVVGLSLSGAGALVFFAIYGVSLLLIHYHPSFTPNMERRMAMFRALNHPLRQTGQQRPQQGEHWIF